MSQLHVLLSGLPSRCKIRRLVGKSVAFMLEIFVFFKSNSTKFSNCLNKLPGRFGARLIFSRVSLLKFDTYSWCLLLYPKVLLLRVTEWLDPGFFSYVNSLIFWHEVKKLASKCLTQSIILHVSFCKKNRSNLSQLFFNRFWGKSSKVQRLRVRFCRFEGRNLPNY